VGGVLGVRLAGEVAFGCHISEDRKHAAVVAAGRDDVTGKILVDLGPFYDHPRSVVVRLSKLVIDHDPVAVVVNPKSQSATLLKPLAEAGVVLALMSVEDVVVAHGEFLDLVEATGLVHLDQPPLTAAVRAGQQRPLAGAQAWDPKVGVDQSPLMAATWACWGFRRWEELAQPSAWVM
jgi:hypothetical protein